MTSSSMEAAKLTDNMWCNRFGPENEYETLYFTLLAILHYVTGNPSIQNET